MDFDAYQEMAMRTASLGSTIEVAALGLAGEAGEFADHVKKHLAQGHPLDPLYLTRELGDIAWYLALAATILGVSLNEVAEMNLAKLRERYPAGFDSQRSRERDATRT